MTDNNKKIVTWPLDKLKPHPKQSFYFREPTLHEVEDLAEHMRGGLINPVEALPDATVLCGHKRVKAAALLGWTEITVWVRNDLADDPVAAERRLVEDNVNRRQMGPLALARCYKHLKTLGRKHLLGFEQQDLRDLIGKRLGLAGRSLDRNLRVVELTPVEVQDAVEAGKLPLTVAEKVAGLPRADKEQIAAEIRNGGDPVVVVRKFITPKNGRHRNARNAKKAFITSLRRGVTDLADRVGESGWITPDDETVLAVAATLIERLQERARQQPQQMSPEDLLADIGWDTNADVSDQESDELDNEEGDIDESAA